MAATRSGHQRRERQGPAEFEVSGLSVCAMRCPQGRFNVAEFGDGALKRREVSRHGLL
jgi:hypothetical protein